MYAPSSGGAGYPQQASTDALLQPGTGMGGGDGSMAPSSAAAAAVQPRALPALPFAMPTLPRNNLWNWTRLVACQSVVILLFVGTAIALIAWLLFRVDHIHTCCSSGAAGNGGAAGGSSASVSSSLDTGNDGAGAWTTASLCGGNALCEYRTASVRTSYTCAVFDQQQQQQQNPLIMADAIVLLGDATLFGSPSVPTNWLSRLLTHTRTVNADRDLQLYSGVTDKGSAVLTQMQTLAATPSLAQTLSDTNKQVVLFVGASSSGASAMGDPSAAATALQQQLSQLLLSAPLATAKAQVSVVMLVPPDPYWGAVSVSSTLGAVTSACVPSMAASLSTDKQAREALRAVYYQVASRHGAIVIDIDAALGRFSFAGPVVMLAMERQQQGGGGNGGGDDLARASSAIDGASAMSVMCNQAVFSDRGHYAMSQLVWQCLAADAYAVPTTLSSV